MSDSRQRFLAACAGKKPDRPPVWMMRQAGRALPEYRTLRKKYSFSKLITSPELAAMVSLQPVNRFGMDACIIFSDILVVPSAMGVRIKYSPTISLSPPVRTRSELSRLKVPEVGRDLGFVAQTIKNVRQEKGNEIAVLGFSGAPYTLACYIMEGSGSKNFTWIKGVLYYNPRLFRGLMERISETVADYLEMQIEAGADAVQLFDTWASELGPDDYEQFVLPHLQKIVSRLKRKGAPIIYYINGIGNLLLPAKKTGADVLGIDWRISLAEVRNRLGQDQAVQGNLDPALLFAPEKIIRQKVFKMLDQTKGRGHIANLGHGLLPDTPLSGIETFVSSVKQWAKRNDRAK